MKNISRFAIFLLLACSVAVFSGCSDDGGSSYIKNIGADASLGGGNTSVLAQNLLTAVNELRNSSALDAYIWCDNAALACAEYLGNATVPGIWNPPEDEDYLHPGAVIDYWKLTEHYIAPSIDTFGDDLLEALTAMKYDTAQEVVDAWANNTKPLAILLHTEYTRMGAACADPHARWVAIFYRP